MKKTIIISTLLLSGFAFSQVGVHTPDPKATFDITAKNATGTSAAPEGILIPRVDRQRAQFMIGVRASTLIYINSVDTGSQTGTAINIDAPGYYYFDGTVWVKFTKNNGSNATNIYNANGLLTGNRTVSQGANRLAFTGNTVNAFSAAGNTFSVDAENKRVGIGTSNPKNKLDLGTEAPTDPTDPAGKKLAVYNNNNFTSFYGLGASENLLQFHASSASNGAPAMVLNRDQNVGIGTTAPNANALLDLSSSNKGFLMPRLTTAQRDAINPKVPGLAIYNSTLNCMQYWNGSSWKGRCADAPPPPVTPGLDCSGWNISGLYGNVNSTINGIPVSATITNIKNTWTSATKWNPTHITCSPMPPKHTKSYEIGTSNQTEPLLGTLKIKFNRKVSNVKIYIEDYEGKQFSIRHVVKSNGVVVRPTFNRTNFVCNRLNFNNATSTITTNSNWEIKPTSVLYTLTGVWFDEIEISMENGNVMEGGTGTTFTMCVGAVQ